MFVCRIIGLYIPAVTEKVHDFVEMENKTGKENEWTHENPGENKQVKRYHSEI